MSSKGVATKKFLLGVGYPKNFIRWGWGTNKCSYGTVGYFQWGLLLPNIFSNSKFREVWWHHSCPAFCLQSCRANQNTWMTLVSSRIHLWKSRTHLEKIIKLSLHCKRPNNLFSQNKNIAYALFFGKLLMSKFPLCWAYWFLHWRKFNS